jgi:hypothetical protein
MSTVPEIDWADVEGDAAPTEPAEPRPSPPAGPIAPTSDSATQGERARVLRHPEIAKKLCEAPLYYSRPEAWNGYVPPAMWREEHNDAPERKALLEIIGAAVAADAEVET